MDDDDDWYNEWLARDEPYERKVHIDNPFTSENVDEILRTHPAFMTGTPTPEDIENSPLLKGLQEIKYSSDDTPTEQAISFKDDGNWHFKHKLYKKAILAYDAALRLKPPESDLMATLHSNKAACNFHLKNYGSSLKDAVASLLYEPSRLKSVMRCAQCCVVMEKYEHGIKWAKRALELDPGNKVAKDYLAKSNEGIKIQERNKRKKEKERKKKLIEIKKLVSIIRSRNIKLVQYDKEIEFDEDEITEADLRLLKSVDSKSPSGAKVHMVKSEFDDTYRLVWPVLFTYPEFKVSEIVEQFHEDSVFVDHLNNMFSEAPSWDENGDYKVSDLEVYYEENSETLCSVNQEETLNHVLSSGKISVLAGTPVFIVISKLSNKFYDHFKSQYKIIK